MINNDNTITQQRLRNTMMFSTTLASIANIAQELIELPTKTLSSVVNMRDNELFEVYPGNFSKLADNKSYEDLYQMRIQLWKDTDTDEPKDEVLDNRLSQVSDAVKHLKALFLGKKARNDVAFQHNKQYHLDQAYKRREQRILEEKKMQENISMLEKENARLKEVINVKTGGYLYTVQSHINEILQTRHIHHLRTKGKLISNN